MKDVELPHCLKPEKWASYLCDIVVSRRTDAAGQGQALMTPRECATEHDRRALGAVCMWNGDAQSAEFLLYMNTAFQSAGRGGEVAALHLSDLRIERVREDDNSEFYDILNMTMYRPKTHTLSNMSIYPDRNSILFDFYFTLGYFLVMSHHSSTDILPTFAEQLKNNNNGSIDSAKVSTLFTALIKKLALVAESYVNSKDDEDEDTIRQNSTSSYSLDKLNAGIRSHGARKATMKTGLRPKRDGSIVPTW